jgi:REP element-mobilizing transposase RayT
MTMKKDEAIEAGIRVEETKHNMKRRKPWHNYQRKGTYMLTLVVDGRQPLLGKLVMPTNNQSAYVELTELGKIIYNEETQKIPYFYKMVEVWKVCIMPDHIHMIVRVKEDMPDGKHLGDVVRGFKVGCSRAWWRLSAIPAGETAGVVEEETTTPAVSPAGKNRPVLFESGYNDQILLEDGQLDNWLHYLDDNPRRLAIKRLHPDYFTTMHYRDIAEWHCQLVGNSFLLDIPDMVAVIVHSAYTDKDYEDYKQKWLAGVPHATTHHLTRTMPDA